jgi:hypothetical protein
MATVSPSLMALSTEGKARRISRTEAVFIVNNYVSLNANVKISVASAWMPQARAQLWLARGFIDLAAIGPAQHFSGSLQFPHMGNVASGDRPKLL